MPVSHRRENSAFTEDVIEEYSHSAKRTFGFVGIGCLAFAIFGFFYYRSSIGAPSTPDHITGYEGMRDLGIFLFIMLLVAAFIWF